MTTYQQHSVAWGIVREARALGIRFKGDHGQLLRRRRDVLPADLSRRLKAHKDTVLLIQTALDTPIPPDGAPTTTERCRFCGACVWLCMAGAWQCGKCHALWRPMAQSAATEWAIPEQKAA